MSLAAGLTPLSLDTLVPLSPALQTSVQCLTFPLPFLLLAQRPEEALHPGPGPLSPCLPLLRPQLLRVFSSSLF